MNGEICLVFVGPHTYYGKLESLVETTVSLSDAREIPVWPGVPTNLDLAAKGPNPDVGCMVSARVKEVILFGVTQVVTMSNDAVQALDALPDSYPQRDAETQAWEAKV